MADKQITELTEATVLNSTDALVIGRGTQALKLLGSTLIQYISRNVVSVTVTTLPEGSEATASFDPNTGVLSLGIPKGDTGDAGTLATPTVAGIMKLFAESGQNTDGTMTQKAITDAIAECLASAINSAATAADGKYVKYNEAQTLTDAQKETARSNILAGAALSNRNLLDNPWFTVNQRGATAFVANGYALDRWRCDSNGNGTISASGIVVAGGAIFQRFEASAANALLGKTVTYSLMRQSGEIISKTFTFPSSFGTTYSATPIQATDFQVQIYVSTSDSRYELFRIVSGQSTRVRAVKLELGPISTLANDVAPDYGEELRKCQRYFVRLKQSASSVVAFIGFGSATSATTARILIPTPVSMREATISVTIVGSLKLSGYGQYVDVTGSPSFKSVTPTGVSFDFYSSGLTTQQPYNLGLPATGNELLLSAEL